jgi:molybdate transport repressor ModE-like protein
MRVALAPKWTFGGEALDARVIPLLRAVAREGSLYRAVAALRVSYRHAWGLLGKVDRAAGQPLVMLERGRGAKLAPLAEKLLAADDAATESLNRELAATVESLNSVLSSTRPRAARDRLIVHASHDYGLLELRDELAASGAVALELRFRGSLECLADLARRECDIAGFHAPLATDGPAALDPYRPWLRVRGMVLVRFASRRQGLMIARGNPMGIRSLGDLARGGLHFVNRQTGSGTRLCFDRLLAEQRIEPARINGYGTEEFTHAAVAATVASGMADAGFGIEAAAHHHGLDFVPLALERYFLAAREATLSRPAAESLVVTMASASFRGRLAELPGYDVSGIGERIPLRKVLTAGASDG